MERTDYGSDPIDVILLEIRATLNVIEATSPEAEHNLVRHFKDIERLCRRARRILGDR